MPGGIVSTQAGIGVIHEEVPANRGTELHGLQLFVNLGAANKLAAPRVLALQGADVPQWRTEADGRVRVVVGAFDGVSSPLVPDEPFTMLDVEVRRQIPYTVQPEHNTVVYVTRAGWRCERGRALEDLRAGQALALSGGGAMTLETSTSARRVVLSGARIDEPVVEEGPFIMNNRAQIEAAIARYRSGAMGGLSPR